MITILEEIIKNHGNAYYFLNDLNLIFLKCNYDYLSLSKIRQKMPKSIEIFPEIYNKEDWRKEVAKNQSTFVINKKDGVYLLKNNKIDDVKIVKRNQLGIPNYEKIFNQYLKQIKQIIYKT